MKLCVVTADFGKIGIMYTVNIKSRSKTNLTKLLHFWSLETINLIHGQVNFLPKFYQNITQTCPRCLQTITILTAGIPFFLIQQVPHSTLTVLKRLHQNSSKMILYHKAPSNKMASLTWIWYTQNQYQCFLNYQPKNRKKYSPPAF